MKVNDKNYIWADWPVPSSVKALVTTRLGGVSESVYKSFNLAEHVNDQDKYVLTNRSKLKQDLNFPQQPFWLQQVHGNSCVTWQDSSSFLQDQMIEADASYANQPNQACVVMTADCLPILLTNQQGNWVAACHAGWRGLASGVVEETIKCYEGDIQDLVAWIGPAISQKHFEVGHEVREVFINLNPDNNCFFEKNSNQRYQFDFIELARQKLEASNIKVYGGDLCSYDDSKRFYSYRRDGQTGRMASLIWLE